MENTLTNLNFQPSSLTEDELKNPLQVIKGYYKSNALYQSRENFWQLLKCWLYYSSEFEDAAKIREMLSFYTQTIELLDASFVYTETL